jgi:phosphohistidine phosphatase SixA
VEQHDVSIGLYVTSTSVRALEQEDERQLVAAIVAELRGKLAVDLDPDPVVDRWPAAVDRPSDQTSKSFLVVGSSHASKVAAELTKLGHKVELIFEAFKNSSNILAEKVKERMSKKAIDVLLFAVLDNSIYQVLTYNGDVIQSRRDNDGHYHMDGDIMVMAKTAETEPEGETAAGKRWKC